MPATGCGREVWPVLVEAFPQAESTLADAARWAQQALECERELASLDLARVGSPAGLDIAAWQALSTVRRSLVLRAWLRSSQGTPAPAALVRRLLAELDPARNAQWRDGADELPKLPRPAFPATDLTCRTRLGGAG